MDEAISNLLDAISDGGDVESAAIEVASKWNTYKTVIEDIKYFSKKSMVLKDPARPVRQINALLESLSELR